MKLQLMMCIKIFLMTKINLTTVIIQKIVHISTKQTKKLGKFKDKALGIPIIEFIGLRSKMYSFIKDNVQNNKTAKGIKNVS